MDDVYKLIVESAEDGIVIIQEGVIKYANPYVEDVLGYSGKSVVGENFLDLIAQESKEEVYRNYQKTIKGEKTAIYEAKIKTRTGDNIFGEIHAHKVTYEGKPADLAIIRNIKARKKTEEVLHRQEERFRAVADNTPDMIARYDEEGRYVYINATAEKELGLSREDVFWKTDKDLGVDDEIAKSFYSAVKSVFKSGERKTFYSQTEGDEKKYYYTILVPEFFKDGTVNSVLSITRDITEIREIDQAKSEFISITSHQLRSPLSIINWCSLSLLRGDAGELTKEQEEYLEKMNDSTRRLIKITDAFLNTTMLDLEMFVFTPEELDVVEIGKEVVRGYKDAVEKKNINLMTYYEEPLPGKIDKRTLKIILRGLLSNAIEYTPEEGNVSLDIRKKGEEEVVIKVEDDGCGISKEDKDKVFTKFYRSERARERKAYGTGLDLYLIKSLLEKIGGSIELQSPSPKFNNGTAFTVTLPATTKEENEV